MVTLEATVVVVTVTVVSDSLSDVDSDVTIPVVVVTVVVALVDVSDDVVVVSFSSTIFIDSTTLLLYISWESITVDPATADINKDGEVNLLDSVILSRYLAGWTNYETYFTS